MLFTSGVSVEEKRRLHGELVASPQVPLRPASPP